MNPNHNSNSVPLRPLTSKEKKVLEFIEGFLQEEGIAPSYQEIRDHFGFASFNSVQRYLKQLQNKKYIYIPGGNQKRAITVLQASNQIQSSMSLIGRLANATNPSQVSQPKFKGKETPSMAPPLAESLSLPLLGKVAAGQPLESVKHDEFVEVPPSMIRYPEKTYALQISGQSMIEDGILDGDFIFVQRQESARNGDTVVALIENEATVKKFFIHKNAQSFQQNSESQVELRPANSNMESLWYSPDQVHIQGIVVGLIRKLF